MKSATKSTVGNGYFGLAVGCGAGGQLEPVVGRETSHVKDMTHLPGIFLFVSIYFFISVPLLLMKFEAFSGFMLEGIIATNLNIYVYNCL